MYSIRETESLRTTNGIRKESFSAYQERVRKSVTPLRVMSFMQDLHSSGKVRSLDCDDVRVRLVVSKSDYGYGQTTYDLVLDFSWCPYVHPKKGAGRKLALKYAQFVSKWEISKIQGERISAVHFGQYVAGVGKVGRDFLVESELYDLLNALYPLSSLHKAPIPLSPLRAPIKYKLDVYADTLAWLATREPDPELKAYFEEAFVEVKKGSPPSPAHTLSPWGVPSAR